MLSNSSPACDLLLVESLYGVLAAMYAALLSRSSESRDFGTHEIDVERFASPRGYSHARSVSWTTSFKLYFVSSGYYSSEDDTSLVQSVIGDKRIDLLKEVSESRYRRSNAKEV